MFFVYYVVKVEHFFFQVLDTHLDTHLDTQSCFSVKKYRFEGKKITPFNEF